jgi:hypothetical protein
VAEDQNLAALGLEYATAHRIPLNREKRGIVGGIAIHLLLYAVAQAVVLVG